MTAKERIEQALTLLEEEYKEVCEQHRQVADDLERKRKRVRFMHNDTFLKEYGHLFKDLCVSYTPQGELEKGEKHKLIHIVLQKEYWTFHNLNARKLLLPSRIDAIRSYLEYIPEDHGENT